MLQYISKLAAFLFCGFQDADALFHFSLAFKLFTNLTGVGCTTGYGISLMVPKLNK